MEKERVTCTPYGYGRYRAQREVGGLVVCVIIWELGQMLYNTITTGKHSYIVLRNFTA